MTQPVAEPTHTVQRAGYANPLTLSILVTDEDYVKVYIDDALLDAAEYTVAGINDPNGIEITITDGEEVDFYPDALTITASFEPPINQPDDLSAGGLFGLAYENAIDKIVRIILFIAGKLDRTLKVPYGVEGDMVLPTAEAGAVIAWNDTADGFQNGPTIDELNSLAGTEAARTLVYPEAPADPVYDAGGRKIGDLGAGTNAGDAINKGQLDTAVAGVIADTDEAIAEGLTNSFRVVPDMATLKALNPTAFPYAYLSRLNYEGEYLWRAGNFVGAIAADPYNGLYAKADGVSASVGAFQRVHRGFILPSWFGAVGDGVTLDDAAIASCFANVAPYQTISFLPGEYLMAGNVPVTVSDVDVQGRCLLQKDDVVAQPMFLVMDNCDRMTWRGLHMDGNKEAFALGNPASALLGHRNSDHKFESMRFKNFRDVGVKYRQSSGLMVDGCFFYNMGENGIEARYYQLDPRTGLAWSGAQPGIFGKMTVNNSHFELIGRIETTPEDSGLVDGCGVTFDCGDSTAEFMEGFSVTGCSFVDCLRGVFSENNAAGRFGSNSVVSGCHFLGTRAEGVDGAYVKMGVGFINVQGFTIAANTFKNIGNYDTTAFASNNAGIVISGNARDGTISTNSIVDNRTPAATTMHYGIQITSAERLIIAANSVHGDFIDDISVAGGLTDISVTANMEA